MKDAPVLLLMPLALAFGPVAQADTLEATLGQDLIEVSHAVDVFLEEGVATYKVRRTFVNRGERADEASLRIELPHGAAATGLRIRGADRWHEGELMEASKAAELYQELTGMGPHAPKDPALLQWVWADEVHLQVFPIFPESASTTEYTLTVPTQYREGRYVVTYPRPPADPDARLARPVLRVFPEDKGIRTLSVGGQLAAPGEPVVIGPAETPVWVGEGEPDPGAGWVFSRLEVARKGAVTRAAVTLGITHTYRQDLAVSLVTPAGAHVLVVDAEGGGENDLAGRFEVALPEGTRSEGAWHLLVTDDAGRDIGTLDRWGLTLGEGREAHTQIAADTPVFIPDAPDGEDLSAFALISTPPPAIDTARARLGRVVAAPDKAFSRLEIDVAPQLSELPRGASVVFVVDASRSIDVEGIEAQLGILLAYLSHVPDAMWEVVLYRRHATRLTGRFNTVAELDARLRDAQRQGQLAPGNGSALERGLEVAAKALRGRKGPLRIVALTDDMLRTPFHPDLAIDALAPAPKAIVHVVVPGVYEDDQVVEERDDTHWLSPIAASHGGIMAYLNGVGGAPKGLPQHVLGLVRPIRIDNVALSGADLDVGEVLDEGQGVRAMEQVETAARAVTLRGQIWARPWHRTVRPDKRFSRATAAFVFSGDHHDDLTEAEMLEVAFEGRVVSPVTSYLAIEPGVRPSTIGIDRGAGAGGFGARGVGRAAGGAGRAVQIPDLAADLAPGVASCRKDHPPIPGWRFSMDVETTSHEVVDVIPIAAPRSDLERCVVEAAWALQLDPGRYVQERHTHLVALHR